MIHHVETVSYGRPATDALRRAVERAKQAGPLHPVTVVVESNLVGLSLRRLLGSGRLGGSGLVNVNFLTALHLAELLAPSPHDSGQPLTNPVLGAAVRRALHDQPGPLAGVVDHPATEAAVAALYAELSHVAPSTLDLLERSGGVAATSVRLHRAVAARLVGLTGEPELAEAVVRRPDLAAQGDRIGTLVWFLPGPLTASLERVMAAATTAFDTTVVVGATGEATADAPVVETCRRLGIEVTADGFGPPGDAEVISAADPDDEVRAALRWVLAQAEAGVALDRTAIFYPAADPYVRSLRQHLAEAGIPANGPSHERLADSAAGRTLLAALELPSQHWRRDRVMALVATAPVRNGDLPVRPGSWETISRVAGVVQGLDDWQRKLAGRQAKLAARRSEILDWPGPTDQLDPGHDPRHDGRRRHLEIIEREVDDLVQLGAFVESLAQRVQAVTGARTWATKAEAAQHLVDHLLGPERRHQSWPEHEQEAAARVADVLARLSLLDPLDPAPTHAVFVRALGNELDVGRGRDGRFGQGVQYGPLTAAPGHDLDAVVVLGMAEGICPARRRDDSLLPDTVRSSVPSGELALRAGSLGDQHRCLLAALAAAPASRRLLVHPRGSVRTHRRHLPSRWLLDTVSERAGRRIYSTEFGALAEPLVQVVTSHSAGVVGAPVPLSLAERDLAQMLVLHHRGESPVTHPAVTTAVARGIHTLSARLSTDFTAYDGNLGGEPIPGPTRDGALMSATGLQQWAQCGFRYFLSHVLALSDRDDPERIHRIQAVDRGSVVHKILERFFTEVIDQGRPAPDRSWSPAQRRRALEIAEEELDALERSGRTGRPVTWRIERARLLRLVDSVLDADDIQRAAHRSTPERVELPFGFDDAEPVVISLPDGRAVRFRGQADRLDRTADGRWLVLDYKTGKPDRYTDFDVDPFNEGTTLQLGLYAEAARQALGGHDASAYYWMVEQPPTRAWLGYDWTDDRRSRFLEVVGAVVEGIDGGVFPLVPGEFDHHRNVHDNCRYCEFDRLCPVDRGDYAEAKVDAPQLVVRARLKPPETEADPDGRGPDR